MSCRLKNDDTNRLPSVWCIFNVGDSTLQLKFCRWIQGCVSVNETSHCQPKLYFDLSVGVRMVLHDALLNLDRTLRQDVVELFELVLSKEWVVCAPVDGGASDDVKVWWRHGSLTRSQL